MKGSFKLGLREYRVLGFFRVEDLRVQGFRDGFSFFLFFFSHYSCALSSPILCYFLHCFLFCVPPFLSLLIFILSCLRSSMLRSSSVVFSFFRFLLLLCHVLELRGGLEPAKYNDLARPHVK